VRFDLRLNRILRWLKVEPLTTRNKIWVAVAALLILAAILAATLVPPSAGARVFQGKPLKNWCLQLLSADPQIQGEATNFFHRFGPGVVPELTILLEPGDPFYRKMAWLHSDWLPRRFRTALLHRVKYPESDTVRMGATRALGLIGPAAESSIPALGKVLLEGRPPAVWESALTLGKLGAASVPSLTNALAQPDPVICQSAAFGLERLGLPGTNAIPALILRLDDEKDFVREASVRALAAMTPPAVGALLAILEQGTATARLEAARALGLAHVSRHVAGAPLLKMSHDPVPEIRAQALASLGDILAIDPPVVARLLEALDETNIVVRATAVAALGKFQNKAAPAVARLTALLQDKEEAVRSAAARSLGQIGPEAKPALPNLEKLLADPAEEVRTHATNAVQRLSGY